MRKKIIVLGNNTIAVDCLDFLLCQDCDVVAVIPEPSDNGQDSWQKSLLKFATDKGLNVLIPKKLSDLGFLEGIKLLKPDIIFSFQCRRILKKSLIDIPKLGTINLHFAPLPKYRGCYPIAWALINGEKEMGVSLHYIDEGVDTGDIIAQKFFKIFDSENARQLFDRSSDMGFELFKDQCKTILDASNGRTTQDNLSAIYYPVNSINFKENRIIWEKDFISVYNWIRAFIFSPFQFPYFLHNETKVEVVSVKSINNINVGMCGEIAEISDDFVSISALGGNIVIEKVRVNNITLNLSEYLKHNNCKEGDLFKN